MAWTLGAFADEAAETCPEQIEALRKAGFDRIDIRSIDGHNIADLPEPDAERIRKLLDAAGVSVGMFGSPIGKIDLADDFQPELGRLEHLGRLKPILGCSWVRIFSYFNAKGESPDQWQAGALDRLRRLRDRAEDLGLVLYHENESKIFGDRCPQIEAIARKLRCPERFRLIFDFDNFNQSGDDVWDNWLRLRDCTDAFHLKDSNTQCQHVPVGEGNGHVLEILTDAQRRGWSGHLSLEPHLFRSKAVMDTGPQGSTHQAFAQMTMAECFHRAADAAQNLVRQVRGADD